MSAQKHDTEFCVATRGVKRANSPGPALLGFTVVAVLVWICLRINFWPSPFGRFAWLDPLLASLALLLVFVVLGVVWVARTLRVVGRDNRWSWWILAAPTVVVGGAAILHFVLPTTTFLDKQGEFEAVALQLRSNPKQTRSRDGIEIGPFDIRFAHATPDGEVYFHDVKSIFLTSIGWVYSPDGPPSGFDDFTSTHLGGPWYEFEAVWRD